MIASFYADLRWFLQQIGAQFVENGLPTSAAALTYTTLFAVVPLMTVGYFMLSVLPAFSGLSEPIPGFRFENFVPEPHRLLMHLLVDPGKAAHGRRHQSRRASRRR